jgi:DNA-binding transcriptional LysR family regulator
VQFINVDLNLLRVFDVIYAHRNLTKAADVLCISQPAVSHALARLRDLYGDPLFKRTPDGMRPTPVADAIHAEVSEALRHVRASLSRGARFQPESSTRRFRFGMGEVVETTVMPRLLPALQRGAPKVSVEVYQHPRRDAIHDLVAGRLDFVVDHVLPQQAQVLRAPLFADDYVCVARREHPTISSSLTLEQYVSARHIQASSRRAGLNYVDTALQELGVSRHIVLQTQNYLETLHALARTDCVLTITRSVAALFDVQVLELPFAVPPLNVSLFWPKASTDDPASAWMRATLLALFDANTDRAEDPSRV